jgi:uncharacterized membrane protein YgcG
MAVRSFSLVGLVGLLAFVLAQGQSVPVQEAAAPSAAEPPLTPPAGVTVEARGPVHEAFASPVMDPTPTPLVPKAPPQPITELPPEQKPPGNVVWIPGYWAWDAGRQDYWWVSGTWRVPPPNMRWVAGYWRAVSNQWQWVPGFWADSGEAATPGQDITYLPAPPATPQVAPPGDPPTSDAFYVPGYWVYQGGYYGWRAGYWARVQPGYVWMPAHYCWTAAGYVFVPGYWDWDVPHRGVVYAPVVINPDVIGPGFAYTPYYAVADDMLMDSLFIGPFGFYYFGDFYGPRWGRLGYHCCYTDARFCHDPLIAYAHWQHGYASGWMAEHARLCEARSVGLAACPPRTLAEQMRFRGSNGRVLVPARDLVRDPSWRTSAIGPAERQLALHQAAANRQVVTERSQVERVPGSSGQARVARLNSVKSFGTTTSTGLTSRRAVPLTTPSAGSWSGPRPQRFVSSSFSSGVHGEVYAPAPSHYAASVFHESAGMGARPSSFTSSGMYRGGYAHSYSAGGGGGYHGASGGGFHGGGGGGSHGGGGGHH